MLICPVVYGLLISLQQPEPCHRCRHGVNPGPGDGMLLRKLYRLLHQCLHLRLIAQRMHEPCQRQIPPDQDKCVAFLSTQGQTTPQMPLRLFKLIALIEEHAQTHVQAAMRDFTDLSCCQFQAFPIETDRFRELSLYSSYLPQITHCHMHRIKVPRSATDVTSLCEGLTGRLHLIFKPEGTSLSKQDHSQQVVVRGQVLQRLLAQLTSKGNIIVHIGYDCANSCGLTHQYAPLFRGHLHGMLRETGAEVLQKGCGRLHLSIEEKDSCVVHQQVWMMTQHSVGQGSEPAKQEAYFATCKCWSDSLVHQRCRILEVLAQEGMINGFRQQVVLFVPGACPAMECSNRIVFYL